MVFSNKGTETVYVSGKISWCRHITPDPKFNKWSVTLHPDAESLEKIRDLQSQGVKNMMKKDDNGYYVQFSRPTFRTIKGQAIPMSPPVVLDKDNQPMEDTAIGNGSDATVKLEVYSHGTPSGGKAKAARFAGLKVTDLIPFNTDTDYPDAAQREQASGLKDQQQPEQIW